jgi:hypothetical protein
MCGLQTSEVFEPSFYPTVEAYKKGVALVSFRNTVK